MRYMNGTSKPLPVLVIEINIEELERKLTKESSASYLDIRFWE